MAVVRASWLAFLMVGTLQVALAVHLRTRQEEPLSPIADTATTESRAPAMGDHWGYDNADAWKRKWPECGGARQSPIDIDSSPDDLVSNKGDVKVLQTEYLPLAGCTLLNNGHSFQVNGQLGRMKLWDGDYQAVQFHFHFPSEHTIDGEKFVGEVHIVHQKNGSIGTDDLVVISMLLRHDDNLVVGTDFKKSWLGFFENLGLEKELPAVDKEIPIQLPVDLGVFRHNIEGDFWHYEGSLTTPPCAETVHWYVLEEPAVVSHRMSSNFRKTLGFSNNRAVQDINDRVVSEDDWSEDGEFGDNNPKHEPYGKDTGEASVASSTTATSSSSTSSSTSTSWTSSTIPVDPDSVVMGLNATLSSTVDGQT